VDVWVQLSTSDKPFGRQLSAFQELSRSVSQTAWKLLLANDFRELEHVDLYPRVATHLKIFGSDHRLSDR
jgi:hypothetical protein